uniref:Prospero domain-containing protein n=1 Tax=Strongyloides stercoralis TaxID=6248 RepID=A0A913HKU3_STRER
MSSGGAIPSSLLHTTNFPLPPLFPQGNFKIPGLNVSNLLPTSNSNHNSPSPQRIKTKRVRQRVDAGEPRNSYQNTTNHTTFLQNKIRQPISSNMNNITSMSNNSIFNNTNNNSLIGSNLSTSSELLELTLKNIAANNSNSSGNIDSERNNKIADDLFEQDVENNKDENVSDVEDKESEESNSLTSSSSSKRKSFTPKQLLEEDGDDSHESTNSPNLDQSGGDETVSESGNIDGIENNKPDNSNQDTTAIVADINQHIGDGLSKFHEYMEVQKRIYSGFLEQQKKVGLIEESKKNNITNNINTNFANSLTMVQNNNQISRDMQRLASALKQEILTSLTGSIDKVIADFTSQEIASRINSINNCNFPFNNTTENNNLLGRSPLIMQSLYNNQFNNINQNSATNNSSGGIFPNPLTSGSFNPFTTSALIGNMSSLIGGIRQNDDECLPPRKKRSKVTDSVRISRYTSSQNSGSVPNSERNSPTLPFNFTSSLVNHSLYGNSSFINLNGNNEERDESPINSDELSDYGTNYDGPQNSQLTPMHLRKAKLMFFYTRYPSSALLKTYFPDIRFNKNNTAQLVKWFSNFREFFYSQMEKYARQAIAEGIKTRDEVVVTPESEIYKQLNQHYNRNNHIQPPERLHLVIQETLREFFCAIQHGKDADPSWKKSIYKVINRLDETIPEYFKDPNFLERLE